MTEKGNCVGEQRGLTGGGGFGGEGGDRHGGYA